MCSGIWAAFLLLLCTSACLSIASCARSDSSLMIHTSRAHHAVEQVRIPHIIHQSWKSTELPERFQKWAKTWRDTHPHWQYR